MELIVALVGMISMIGAPVCLIGFLIQLMRKRPNKRIWGILTICYVILFLVCILIPTGNDDLDEGQPAVETTVETEAASSENSKPDETSVTETESSESSKSEFEVVAESTDVTMTDIESDGIAEKLMEFGMTAEEAQRGREILIGCGVESIDNCEPTSEDATIDGLVMFREEIDKDRVFWFTVDNREIFYVALNGNDLYDADKGGFLMTIDEVHIPDSSMTEDVKLNLLDLTEQVLDQYFTSAKYYDAWGFARSDSDYMVQCDVYASNALKVNSWVQAKVWYTASGDGNFEVTGVMIDGVQYEVIG